MTGYLLDTNCISELVRVRPAPNVVHWFDSVDETTLYLSVLTIGEIRKGVASLPHSKRRDDLESWLQTELTMRFADRLLVVSEQIANLWGQLSAEAQRKGKSLPVIDGL